MPPRPGLSKAELEIARIVWELKSAGVRQVFEALPAPVGLGFGPIFSQYQVLQIAPALVYDVNDQLSVSISPLVDLGVLQVDPSVISAPDDANGDGFANYPPGTHSGAAWGAGFSLGVYYRAGDWGFGSSYKSPQWFQSYSYNTTNELGQPRKASAHIGAIW